MDFRFTKEEEEFREEVREFARRELPPGWWLGTQGEEYTADCWQFTRRIARKLGERGWLSLRWPREYGGGEASFFKELIFREEAAYWGIPASVMGVGGTSWVAPCLLKFGTKSQKARFLPPLARGEEFWCTGYSEPGAGSDLASLKTSAVRQNNEYIVQGQKVWISAAQIADWCWLLVRTDTNLPKSKGLSLLMVDMKSPGITVRGIQSICGAETFNEVFFDGVHVPVDNRVGEENQAWAYIEEALKMERGWPPIRASAGARRMLDEILKYCRERATPLKPTLRSELAGAATEVEAARLLAYRAAYLISRGVAIKHEASVAKVFGSELLEKIADLGMRILGAYGLLEPDSPGVPLNGWIEHLYLTSRGMTLAAGASEIQRTIIATRGLGMPMAKG